MIMIVQLLEKKCIRKMPETECSFFSPCFSSTQEGRGLATDNSLVGSKQLSSPGYIRDGHVSQGKASGSSGQGRWTSSGQRRWTTGDVAGLIRRLPLCPHSGRLSEIPVFSRTRHSLHVSSPYIRPELLAMGLYGGSETAKALDSSLTVDPVFNIWINLHHSFQAAETGTGHLLQLCLRLLGLLVNEEKSELTPSQDIVFLGRRLDFRLGWTFQSEIRKSPIVVGCSGRSRRRRSARHEGRNRCQACSRCHV